MFGFAVVVIYETEYLIFNASFQPDLERGHILPRLAAAHRRSDTNAPGGHLNQTPGEGVCVSHVAACTVLRLPAPSEAPPDVLVPAKGQADRAAAWAHGAAGTRAPGSHLT